MERKDKEASIAQAASDEQSLAAAREELAQFDSENQVQ